MKFTTYSFLGEIIWVALSGIVKPFLGGKNEVTRLSEFIGFT